MKVLQVNCVYNTGSTGKLVHDVHTQLKKQGIESVVCYGRGAKINESGVYKTCSELYSKFNNLISRFTGVMYGGCFLSTNRLISVIKSEKPDIVHLHCINGYFVNIYRLVTWLKNRGIRTVLTLHSEFMYTANCGYAFECENWKNGCGNCPRYKAETKSILLDNTAASWRKMKKAFDGFDDNLIVTSVSPWLMERASRSQILGNKKHVVVLNGIDTGIFHPYDNSKLREQYHLTSERIIFHATASFSLNPDSIKGGYYIIELAKQLREMNVKVFVAGPYDEAISVPDNVILLGKITDQQLLAQYYSMADVTVIASKRETFSMICAESLCCGTPVAGFRAGAPEQISLPEYSEFVDYGDISLLTDATVRILNGKCGDIPKNKTEIYDRNTMCINYLKTYKELLTKEL